MIYVCSYTGKIMHMYTFMCIKMNTLYVDLLTIDSHRIASSSCSSAYEALNNITVAIGMYVYDCIV